MSAMVSKQIFHRNSESENKLSIFFHSIDKNTKLEDILDEVKKIHSTHFPDLSS